MADIQSRGTRHAKKQENLAHNNERKKSIMVGQGEGEADSPLSQDPDLGLDPGTQGS